MVADETPTAASAETFAALDAHDFAVLTTYRRNGAAMPTTVWFAHDGGKLYIQSAVNGGKIKRIRANGAVTIAPSGRTGEVPGATVAATARVLPPEESGVAEASLVRKYGERRRRAMEQQGGSMARDFIEVSPTA